MTDRRTWAALWVGVWLVLGAANGPRAAAAAAPSIRVVPTPVPAGSTVTVFGHDFCGTADCPAVQIDADGQHFATSTVGRDGSFSVRVPVHLIPNEYHVRAQQLAASGTLTATTGMTVLPPETRPSGPIGTTYPVSPSPARPKTPASPSLGQPTRAAGLVAATPTTSAEPISPSASTAAARVAATSSPHGSPALALGLLAGVAAAIIPLTLLLRLALRRGRA